MLRFAVHPPTQRSASPRCHRMPCGDVPGRIHVSVVSKSAGPADEDGLTLARLRIRCPTHTAALRGERGTDSLDSVMSLVLEPTYEQAPPVGQDAPVEDSFLTNVLARLVGRPVGGSGHGGDAQVLDADHVEPSGQVSGRFLDPVFSPGNPARLKASDGQPYSSTARRPGFRTCQCSLQPPESGLLGLAETRAVQQFTSGQRGRYHDASVNRSKRDVPAPRAISGDAVRLRWRDSARPAKPYPAHLRDSHLTCLPGKPTNISGPECDNPEALVSACLAPSGPAMGTSEVIPHGLAEVPQRLLLHHCASAGKPGECGTGLAQPLVPTSESAGSGTQIECTSDY